MKFWNIQLSSDSHNCIPAENCAQCLASLMYFSFNPTFLTKQIVALPSWLTCCQSGSDLASFQNLSMKFYFYRYG